MARVASFLGGKHGAPLPTEPGSLKLTICVVGGDRDSEQAPRFEVEDAGFNVACCVKSASAVRGFAQHGGVKVGTDLDASFPHEVGSPQAPTQSLLAMRAPPTPLGPLVLMYPPVSPLDFISPTSLLPVSSRCCQPHVLSRVAW